MDDVTSPPNMVSVILSCKILMFTCIKQSTYYFDGNNCKFLLKFHDYNLKGLYLTNITYLIISNE